MCALGYYLESQGIATTGIALVRENAESLQPPRLLWVPFPLGRPLGKPNDAAFQRRVIGAALTLLERPAGPVLEDFPEDLPNVAVDAAPACPVTFAWREAPESDWNARLVAELRDLSPWYDLSRRRRGRTTVGICATPIDQIVPRLAGIADDPDTREDLVWLKRALEDMKAFYQEALTAQPGDYAAGEVERILWHGTAFGALMKHLYEHFKKDAATQGFARILAPRSAVGEGTGSSPVVHLTNSRGDEL